MQRITRLIFLMILLSAITQSVQSQDVISSGSGSMNYKTAPAKPVLTAEQIAQRFLPGVALIICDDGKGHYSQGSGIFIGNGTILTNAHVVKGMVRGVVIAGGQQKKNLINMVVYFNSENTDLAVLHSVEAESVKKTIPSLAKPNDLKIGETVYVLSNPEGLAGTISQGIISSGVRRINNMDLLQITAPISEGSSGGAVLNSRGEVIGLATASLQSGQNLNFAVPAASIKLFTDNYSIESKSLEYVQASKIPNSWYVPKSFLSQSESNGNKRISSSASDNDSTSTFEKVKLWLTDKLVGRSFVAGKFPNEAGDFPRKTERIVFNGCEMYVEQKSSSDKGTLIELYRVSINSVKDTFIPPISNNLISLTLSNKIQYISQGYAVNNYTNKPDVNDSYTTDTVMFATDNRNSSEQIEKAFNFIMKSCKETKK